MRGWEEEGFGFDVGFDEDRFRPVGRRVWRRCGVGVDVGGGRDGVCVVVVDGHRCRLDWFGDDVGMDSLIRSLVSERKTPESRSRGLGFVVGVVDGVEVVRVVGSAMVCVGKE